MDNGTVNLIAPLASAVVWFFLTIMAKAIGRRIKPGKFSDTFWDAVLDVTTLIFAWQVALSLGETKLIKTIVTELKGGSVATANASGWAFITGTVIGAVFLAYGLFKGRKFAKEDELPKAWKPLLLFALSVLVASSFLPWVDGAASWISTHATVPVGKAVVTAANYAFSAPH